MNTLVTPLNIYPLSALQWLLTRATAGLLVSVSVMLVAVGCATAAGDPSAQKGDFVTLTTADGLEFRAYVAGPQDADAGILLVHDYFGISDFTRQSVERLGAQGYRTVAVDLYGGRSTTSDEEATELMQALDQTVTDAILQSGIDYLKSPNRRIGTLGFSMGGPQALIANLNDPGAVSATAIVYGGSYQDLAASRIATLQSPVLAIAGLEDDWARSSAIQFLEPARAQGIDFSMYLHPGVGHAYAQPLFHGGENYDAEATRVTWLLVDDFLSRHLGQG